MNKNQTSPNLVKLNSQKKKKKEYIFAKKFEIQGFQEFAGANY